jgi:hypothetical protein
MEIQLPSTGLFDYARAQAWQGVSLRQQQPDQDPSVKGIQPGGGANVDPVGGKKGGSASASGVDPVTGKKECQACKNRKYKDGSGDSTVSFQTPTKLSPAAAEVAVRAHEQQHVAHEQARAKEEGRVVVSQDVVIHYAICPECGRMYVAGGTTTTATRASASATYSAPVKHGESPKTAKGLGKVVDARL